MEEIEKLHNDAHQYKNGAINNGVSEKRIVKYVLKKMFGKESFIGQFSRGGVSIKNLILSLLDWDL